MSGGEEGENKSSSKMSDDEEGCANEGNLASRNGVAPPTAATPAALADVAVDRKGFAFEETLTLETVRQLHNRFCEERDWDQFHAPRNLLLALVAEVGELAELFQWRGESTLGLADWSDADRTSLGEELSDVLIYLIRLADRSRVDLATAVLRKMELNRRKYPADRVAGSSKKYTEYQETRSEGESSEMPGAGVKEAVVPQ